MNNDSISREALRNVILNDRKLDGANANWEVNRILVHIEKAPTVDIKDQIAGAYNEGYMCGNKEAEKARPQGKWIEICDIKSWQFTNEHYECDKCHYKGNKSNFCPNCGADMRGEK